MLCSKQLTRVLIVSLCAATALFDRNGRVLPAVRAFDSKKVNAWRALRPPP